MNRTVGRTRLRWLVSHVRALVEAGWGARFRYWGVIVDPDGAPIEVIAVERLLLGADHGLNTVRNSRSCASRSSIAPAAHTAPPATGNPLTTASAIETLH